MASDASGTGQRTRVVVVGADAAGMSAAHQALRRAAALGRSLEVVALEQSQHTSYSACGLPYWIAGDLAETPGADDGSALVARTPAQHRASGIDLRTGVRGHTIDLAARVVHAVDAAGLEQEHPYDELVIATGAAPVTPAWALDEAGALRDGVRPVHTLDDGAAWRRLLEDRLGARRPDDRPLPVAVVGAGYVGVEVAEALLRRGCRVELFAAHEVVPAFEEAIRDQVRSVLRAAGVHVHEHAPVEGLRLAHDGAVRGVHAPGATVEAELVVLAMGVEPRTPAHARLSVVGGELPTGERGAFVPDDRQRLAPHVWTAGDCALVRHRMLGTRVFLPLGTHANKHGRVAGENLAGGAARSEGALGTAITRFAVGEHHLEMARTGLDLATAVDAGFQPQVLLHEGTTASGYMPEARPARVWIAADRRTRRLLGVQVAGGEGTAKRIDTAAAVLWTQGSVDDLAAMDLSYAPPFSTVWELVQIAARRLADRL